MANCNFSLTPLEVKLSFNQVKDMSKVNSTTYIKYDRLIEVSQSL